MRALKITLIAAPFLAAGIARADTVMAVTHFPPGESMSRTDEILTRQLTEQGYTNVKVWHGSDHITVTGTHDYKKLNLRYDPATGMLVHASEMTDWDALKV